jgi:hypothetical protein
MSREAYFVVQRIYDGWDQLAYVLYVELVDILAETVLHRSVSPVIQPALASLIA